MPSWVKHCPDTFKQKETVSGQYRRGSYILCSELNAAIFERSERRVKQFTQRSHAVRRNVFLRTAMSMFIHVAFSRCGLFGCRYCCGTGHPTTAEVNRIVWYCTLDWNYIIETGNGLGINKRLLTALWLAHQVLDTPLPERLIQQAEKFGEGKKLIHKLYPDENGTRKLHAPTGLPERLYIDILSDTGIPVVAGIKKLYFAASFLFRPTTCEVGTEEVYHALDREAIGLANRKHA